MINKKYFKSINDRRKPPLGGLGVLIVTFLTFQPANIFYRYTIHFT